MIIVCRIDDAPTRTCTLRAPSSCDAAHSASPDALYAQVAVCTISSRSLCLAIALSMLRSHMDTEIPFGLLCSRCRNITGGEDALRGYSV